MVSTKQQIKDLVAKDKLLADYIASLQKKVDDLEPTDFNALYEEFKKKNQGGETPPPPPDHTCPQGQHWDDAQGKCVDDTVTPPPPPPPNVIGLPDLSKGTVLFDSNTIWNNGHARTMTGHHEFDPDDPKTEVAAGGHGTPRKWEVLGNGHCKLSGGMSRVYNHNDHNGTIVILDTFIFNGTLDNRSYEWFSRHNEGGPPENRTGGDQNHFALKTRGAKHESYHASYHETVSDGPYPNGKQIKVGDEVRIAIVGTKNGRNYKSTSFIDWDHNGNYEKVMESDYNETETPAGADKQPLYWRFRNSRSKP